MAEGKWESTLQDLQYWPHKAEGDREDRRAEVSSVAQLKFVPSFHLRLQTVFVKAKENEVYKVDIIVPSASISLVRA